MNDRLSKLRLIAFNTFISGMARPIQAALRRFPWPIKKRILRAPPLPATGGDCNVIVMTTGRDWLDALWSAYSWQYFAGVLGSPTIVIDGQATEEMRRNVAEILPGASVRVAEEYLDASDALLPEGRLFFRCFKYGRKAAVILSSANSGPVVFSDADVLLFREPTELLSRIVRQPQRPLYNVGGGGNEWNAPSIIELMLSEKIAPMPGFNSGLMYIPASTLDRMLCARCMSTQKSGEEHFFTEQSLFNALMSKAGAQPLDAAAYLVSDKGMYFYQRDIDYSALSARHFTGVVRHKMYTAGMPFLARKLHF